MNSTDIKASSLDYSLCLRMQNMSGIFFLVNKLPKIITLDPVSKRKEKVQFSSFLVGPHMIICPSSNIWTIGFANGINFPKAKNERDRRLSLAASTKPKPSLKCRPKTVQNIT